MSAFPPAPSLLRPAALLFTLLLALPALAATPIDETRPLDPDGRFSLSTNIAGRIEIQVWDRAEVQLTGTLADGVDDINISGSARHLEARLHHPETRSSWFGISFSSGRKQAGSSTLYIKVPRTANLDLKNLSAALELDGVAGQTLAISSVSGDMAVTGSPHKTTIESVSGDIALTLDGSRDLSVINVSGDVRVQGALSGKVALTTVAGDLRLDAGTSVLERITLNTTSGDARIQATLAANGEISASTLSGNLVLITPDTLSARVSGSSFSGRLRAPGVDARRSFEHRYGEGDGDIKLSSFSGDVTLKWETAKSRDASH